MRMRVLVMRGLLLWTIRSKSIVGRVLHWEELAFEVDSVWLWKAWYRSQANTP